MKCVAAIVVLAAGCTFDAAVGADRERSPTAILRLEGEGHVQDVVIRVSVGDQSYHENWGAAVDSIFRFADTDLSGSIDEREARLVPSAKGVRLSLGTGFVPPVDPVGTVRRDILGGRDGPCDREALHRYYAHHGVGCLPIGHGELPNTGAITTALVRFLDGDGDGGLSEPEFLTGEKIVDRLDGNDDDLIGPGELLDGLVYPGRAADVPIMPSATVDLSVAHDRSFTLRRLPEDAGSVQMPDESTTPGGRYTVSRVDATPTTCRHVAIGGGLFRGDAWSVPGRLTEQFERLSAGFAGHESDDEMMNDAAAGTPWLKAVADRDDDGAITKAERDGWLALQHEIIKAHLLVSVYSGGGLFEVLDRNHDAALSVRELRNAWRVLEDAGYTKDGRVTPANIPSQILLVVSHGYPIGLTKKTGSDVRWFMHMDRNGDGDVSRREFTGDPDAFHMFDVNRDGLISPPEAVDPR